MTNRDRRTTPCLRVVFTLLAVAFTLVTPGAAHAQTHPRTPLTVLIGTSGVTWQDISDSTPNLLTTTRWAAGSLAARSVGAYSCPPDGWLAVSSGNRARSTVNTGGACAGSSTFSQAREQARRDGYSAQIGLLGQTLAHRHIPTTGIGPGARLALDTRAGAPAGRWQPRTGNLGAQVRAAAERGGLLVIDLGDRRSDDLPTIDARFGDVMTNLPTGARVVFASLADGSSPPHLQAVAERGPAGALLSSGSTRQPGLVTATDIAPTLLDLLGVARPDAMVGSPMSAAGTRPDDADRPAQLRDADRHAQQMHSVVPWFVVVTYLPGVVLLCWAWWRCSRRGVAWPRWSRRVAGWYAMVPAATYLADLVPWWRVSMSFLVVEALVVALAAGLAAVAAGTGRLLPPTARPWARLAWPAVVTSGVFIADMMTGSRLQISSLLGLQPLEAGRFYGLGNPQFALFATGALLLAGAGAGWWLTTHPTPPADHWARPRRIAAAWTLTVAVVAVAVDATPGLGSDFGGPPALFPAMVLLTVLVLGFRVTWRKVLVVAVATVALSALVAVADWLRPADQRTHLGQFVQTLIDGGGGAVIGRKVGTNLHILFSSPATAAIPVVTVAGAWYVLRPVPVALRQTYAAAPVVRHLLVAWFVMVTLAFLLNDAGPIVPPVAAMLLLPSMFAFLPWPTAAGPLHTPAAPRD